MVFGVFFFLASQLWLSIDHIRLNHSVKNKSPCPLKQWVTVRKTQKLQEKEEMNRKKPELSIADVLQVLPGQKAEAFGRSGNAAGELCPVLSQVNDAGIGF